MDNESWLRRRVQVFSIHDREKRTPPNVEGVIVGVVVQSADGSQSKWPLTYPMTVSGEEPPSR